MTLRGRGPGDEQWAGRNTQGRLDSIPVRLFVSPGEAAPAQDGERLKPPVELGASGRRARVDNLLVIVSGSPSLVDANLEEAVSKVQTAS
ncbi:hypothetical protein SAMN05442782_0595 [Streptomyces sp. OK228]|nr:hypothetical protein SAMN05442782_0595 [Streptomyces sp. OK228]